MPTDRNNFENILNQNQSYPKKRGRPRKEELKSDSKKNGSRDPKKTPKLQLKNIDDEQIILRLPLDDNDNNSTGSEKNLFTMKDDSEQYPQCNPSESEDDISDSDLSKIDVKQLINEIRKKDLIIRRLKSDLSLTKDSPNANLIGLNKDVRSKMLDLKLINLKDGKPTIVDRTTCACFWCTETFDSLPIFLPDKLINGRFYVFGCFCTPSCARKYNSSMADYRTATREMLLIRLYGPIFGDIPMAPERELLDKFLGPLTINEFRSTTLLLKRDIKMRLPPVIPLIPIVEDDPKNASSILIPLKVAQIKQKGKKDERKEDV